MSKKRATTPSRGDWGLGGILKGLGGLVETLGELADTGGELSQTGQVGGRGQTRELKGVYGFTVKVGLGDQELKVQPFGNIRRDEEQGRAVVHEVTEPAVDLFDEADHLLLVAETPGISAADVHLAIKNDVLIITAERGNRKYRKEVLLPRSVPLENMQVSCTNGVLEIRCVG